MYGLLLLINKNPQISTTLPSINIENVFIIPCKFYMFESVSGISQVFCCTYLTMRNVRNIKKCMLQLHSKYMEIIFAKKDYLCNVNSLHSNRPWPNYNKSKLYL